MEMLPSNLASTTVSPSSSFPINATAMRPPSIGDQCICGSAIVNKQCTHKKCQNCCSKVNNFCVVSSHQKKKKSNFSEADLNQFAALINQAMQTREEVMLVYNGGSTPGMARLVKPLRWVHNGRFMFIGMCGRQKTEKNFFLRSEFQ